jgi:hypothetical protein
VFTRLKTFQINNTPWYKVNNILLYTWWDKMLILLWGDGMMWIWSLLLIFINNCGESSDGWKWKLIYYWVKWLRRVLDWQSDLLHLTTKYNWVSLDSLGLTIQDRIYHDNSAVTVSTATALLASLPTLLISSYYYYLILILILIIIIIIIIIIISSSSSSSSSSILLYYFIIIIVICCNNHVL